MPNQRRSDISRHMKPERHPKLAHLTEPQMQALIERYYAGAKTSELVAEFGIGARPSDLIKLFPPVVLDTQCPYCAVSLWQAPRSKSASRAPQPYCPQCRHEHTEGTYRHCHCAGCRKHVADVEAAIVAKKRELVREGYPSDEIWQNPSVDHLLGQLTLRDVVFLSALYRNAHIDREGTAGAPYATERPLSPTSDLSQAMLSHLARRRLVRVAATSPLDSFQFDDELTRVTAYYTFEVRYRILPMLPIDLIGEAMHTIDVMADDSFWHGEAPFADEALALWKELALHECLETFVHQGQLHKLQPPTGEKTIVMFQALLDTLSVAQVYNLVWSSARNAAAYYQRGGVNKAQASNSMVGGCRTRADKAKVEGWPIKPYGRNYERPRSELSLVLHDVFLKIGELGFTTAPSRAFIQSQSAGWIEPGAVAAAAAPTPTTPGP